MCFFFQKDSFIYFQVVKAKKPNHAEYQRNIQSKVGLARHRKTHHLYVQKKNLTDSFFTVKQSKQLKKQQPKLLIKSFAE